MAGSYTYPNQDKDPDTRDVLRNRFNLRSHSSLKEAEYAASDYRLSQIYEGRGPNGSFDTNHLKAIHQHIFQDVYEWAGYTRNERPVVDGERVEIIPIFSKGKNAFLHGSRIEMGLNAALGPLRDLSALRESSIETFSARAGEVLGELNYVHPFREGNGRTQESFIQQLGAHVGHDVDFTVITRTRMIEASIQVHHDPSSHAMRHLVEDAVDPGRRETLRSMLESLQRSGVDPQEYSIRTARPGEEITGRVMGENTRIPAIVTKVDLVAISRRDLPTVRSAEDRVITVTARTPFEIEPPSRMTVLDTGMPFIPAVTHWTDTVEQTVARAVEAHPTVRAFLRDAQVHAGHIWKEPEPVIARLREEAAQSPATLFSILSSLSSDPQSYGELRGGRTLLLKPDDERQHALDRIPVFTSSIGHFFETAQRLEPSVRQTEVEWRTQMARPVPSLSPDALAVVHDLAHAHQMKSREKEPAHQLAVGVLARKEAWNEVKDWRHTMDARLTVPNAIERIPGLSEEKKTEIKSTLSLVNTAVREANLATGREHDRGRAQERSLDKGRETGIGY